MIAPFLLLLTSVVLSLAVDVYICCVIRHRTHSAVGVRWQLWSAIALYVVLIAGILLPTRGCGEEQTILLWKMWLFFVFVSVFFAKLCFVIVDLLGGIPRIFGLRRLPGFTIVGIVIAGVLFCSIWWGALVGRFNIRTEDIEVPIDNLPESFNGYRIVQISDLHVGTYGSDTRFVSRLVSHVNELHPDLIVFTGDIVNRTTAEIMPFVEDLSRLHAHDGVYAILGNHDYGDYYEWPDSATRLASLRRLCEIERGMGWRLLLNEHRFVSRGADSIAIVGVENVGDPMFAVYGDLGSAYPTPSDSVTKILLTHNPAHWGMEILPNPQANFALTLSGHTHAMQIEIFGWSPARWHYPHWGGLYKDETWHRHLYVNIGTGTVGLPMRLGATPEVTIITLRSTS